LCRLRTIDRPAYEKPEAHEPQYGCSLKRSRSASRPKPDTASSTKRPLLFGPSGVIRVIKPQCVPRVSSSSGASSRRLGRLVQPLFYFLSQEAEIDGLRKQSGCPKCGRSPSGRFVPIGGDHDDGNAWTFRFHLGKHFKSGHARHVDIGQDQDQRRVRNRFHLLQRSRRRQGKFHHEASRPQIPAELLPEHDCAIVDFRST